MKILIVTTKWAAGDSNNHPDATYAHLIKPALNVFKDKPETEIIVDFIEEDNIWSVEALNQRLLLDDFDICIFSPFKNIVPDLSVAKKLGKKLFICAWDSHNASTKNRLVNLRIFLKNIYDNGVVQFNHSLFEYSQYCNILVFDNCYGQIFPNVYSTFVPMNVEELYPIDENEKKYDLAFIGSQYERERFWYISNLQKSDLPFNHFGGKGENEQKLSYEDWAKINREAKISLNFNGNSFFGARKCRAWEIAACKNFMITTLPEVYNSSSGKLFVDGEHFVSINESNYLSVIKYYLDNDQERIAIANNMHEYWKKNYTAQIWWDNIIRWSNNV
jgi:hypothetical protein